MSWVPSPSPRMNASYVAAPMLSIPTVLCVPSMSPMAASCAPSALSFGMATASPPIMMHTAAPPSMPYQAPRPQQRQGSFTPAPSVAQASPAPHWGMHPSLAQMNTPYHLGSMNNIPYAAPASTPAAREQNRSWTPLPINSVLGGLERPRPNPLDDRLSQSLMVLPFDAQAESRQFSNKPKQQSFDQAPMPVIANIYWQRSIALDEQGRVQRRLGGDNLSFASKTLKDVLGVYHVGIEVHGQEYTFGNYRAPGSRMVGHNGSGVYCHQPQRPGPQNVFKHAETLGSTTVAPGHVEELCCRLGNMDFSKASYNKIHHNCVDFARALSSALGTGEIPAWCYRGAAIAKVMGLGGGPVEDENESFQIPSFLEDPAINSRKAAMDLATRSHAGIYVAPPPFPGPFPGAGTYVAPPPFPGPFPGSCSGTYVAPPFSGTYVGPPPFMAAVPRIQQAQALAPTSMMRGASFPTGMMVPRIATVHAW